MRKTIVFAIAVALGGCGPCGGGENAGWEFDVGGDVSSGAAAPMDADTGVEEPDLAETSVETVEPRDTAGLPPAVRNACGLGSDAGGDVGSGDTGCPVQEPDAFGDCGQSIGAVFDGAKCVEVEGCPCQGSGCPAFESIEACARECGRGGWCQRRQLPFLGTHWKRDYCPRKSCWGPIAVCARGGTNPEPRLEAALPEGAPGVKCGRPGQGFCAGYLSRPTCSRNDWCCAFGGSELTSTIDAPLFRHLCRLSLMPSVVGGGCIRRD